MTETDVNIILGTLEAIRTHLASIDRQLKQMPEIQAAVFLQMQEEADSAKLGGISAKGLWTICPPAQR